MPNRHIALVTTLAFLFSHLSYAVNTPVPVDPAPLGRGRTSEYQMENFPGEVKIKVKILGGVRVPGQYYLPVKTDLITAITLAGGVSETGDAESVLLSRDSEKKEAATKINLTELVESGQTAGPAIYTNDIIYVSPKTPLWSPDVVATIGVVSGILAIVVTGYLVASDNR